MERGRGPTPRRRDGDRTDRWLRFARDGGIALVGIAALAGLARDLSATRGPVVAWIVVTLLGGAAGLFAWSLLEAREGEREGEREGGASLPSRPTRGAKLTLPTDGADPQTAVPLVPLGLFPPLRRASAAPERTYRVRRDPGPRARTAPREVRMRTRRTPAACAAEHTRRPVARTSQRRRPPTTA